MESLYVPATHPRTVERAEVGPPKVADAIPIGGGPISRLNARFGLAITIGVGSMLAAYLFTMLALVSLPSALRSHDKIVIVSWIAQTFLQLVLLPIIIVGQNVQAAAADKRAQATFDDAEAMLFAIHENQTHMKAQDAALLAIMKQLDIQPPTE